MEHVLRLQNKDGTYCCLDRRVQTTPLGRIGGISGIIAKKAPNHELHIYEERLYMGRLKSVLEREPDILVTHQPLKDHDLTYYPKLHLCGHWYATDDEYIKEVRPGRYLIICDSRILVIT